jgi:quercetin dioxygenase-like cupin family protein
MLAKLSCIAILLMVGLGAGAVWAQDDAIKRTILQKTEVPGTPYVTVLGTAEIKAGATVGRHSHPGTESGYVIEGGGVLLVQGQPPRQLQPGDSFLNPTGTPHSFRSGDKPTKIVSSFVVEKDKPLASPAPE